MNIITIGNIMGGTGKSAIEVGGVYVEGRFLYISASEWDRLCHEKSTGPLVSVLRDARSLLEKDGAVRLIGLDGGISISADRPSELHAVIDFANVRRASLGLAPVILVD